MKTFANILILFVLANFSLAEDKNQHKSSPEEFKEFCDQVEGRWITHQKVTTVWPKLGFNKGDTLTHYVDFQRELDGIVLVSQHKFGNIKWRVTYHYDAVNSRICSNGNGSNGFWSRGFVWQTSGNEFAYSVEGGQSNGQDFSGSGTRTISDDGKKFTTSSGDTRLGDGAKAKSQEIYEKISN